MQVKLPVHPIPVSLTGGARLLADTWRVGQIIQATVGQRTSAATVSLRVGQTSLTARTAVNLPQGQALKLQVVSVGREPVLKILPGAPTEQQVYVQAMRNSLPGQVPLSALVDSVAGHLNRGGAAMASVPRESVEPMVRLLAALPRVADLTRPEGLKRALRDSGAFLEARLAAVQDSPLHAEGLQNDLKAVLLKLLAALKRYERPPALSSQGAARGGVGAWDAVLSQQAPEAGTERRSPALADGEPGRQHSPSETSAAPALKAPPRPAPDRGAELLERVEGALHRVQVNQLHSVAPDRPASPLWHLELPVRDGNSSHVVELHIERERRTTSQGEQDLWSLQLSVQPDGIGRIVARISLSGETVSTLFWAERAETAALIEAHRSTGIVLIRIR